MIKIYPKKLKPYTQKNKNEGFNLFDQQIINL
jgi:hypothetical protein